MSRHPLDLLPAPSQPESHPRPDPDDLPSRFLITAAEDEGELEDDDFLDDEEEEEDLDDEFLDDDDDDDLFDDDEDEEFFDDDED